MLHHLCHHARLITFQLHKCYIGNWPDPWFTGAGYTRLSDQYVCYGVHDFNCEHTNIHYSQEYIVYMHTCTHVHNYLNNFSTHHVHYSLKYWLLKLLYHLSSLFILTSLSICYSNKELWRERKLTSNINYTQVLSTLIYHMHTQHVPSQQCILFLCTCRWEDCTSSSLYPFKSPTIGRENLMQAFNSYSKIIKIPLLCIYRPLEKPRSNDVTKQCGSYYH